MLFAQIYTIVIAGLVTVEIFGKSLEFLEISSNLSLWKSWKSLISGTLLFQVINPRFISMSIMDWKNHQMIENITAKFYGNIWAFKEFFTNIICKWRRTIYNSPNNNNLFQLRSSWSIKLETPFEHNDSS